MRSFIMIGVVFFAMLVDRPAVSMRNLAIAALIVLLLQPEAAVDAGFQMSFLAVLGLVTFHDVWSRRQTAHDEAVRAWPWRLVRHAAAAVMLALVTTAIAGTMSSIPASLSLRPAGPLQPGGQWSGLSGDRSCGDAHGSGGDAADAARS